MKSLLVVLGAMVWAGSVPGAMPPGAVAAPASAARPGRIVVQFTDASLPAVERAAAARSAGTLRFGAAELDALNERWQARAVRDVFERPADTAFARTLGLRRFRILEIGPAADPVAAAAEYARDPHVITAEPDWVATPDAVPNDPYYAACWGHHNTGQLPSWNTSTNTFTGPPVGTPGFDCGAQTAWDSPVGYGNLSTVIALIDTDGVDMQHSDLRLLPGWDFTGNDSNPDDPCTAPGIGCGHGTMCAGLMAGIANNGIGVTGIAGGCWVLPFRAQATSEVAAALTASADSGAAVANMSFTWYGVTSNAAVAAAASYAAAHDVLLLSSSGNRNDNSVMWMPQVLPEIYAIGAASPCGTRKRSSSIPSELRADVQPDPAGASCDNERNWGSSWGSSTQGAANALDLLAPVILPSSAVGGGYEPFFSGTSASCAYASGVAALLRAVNPSWSATQTRDRLFATATDITGGDASPGWDAHTGWGLIHAANAIGPPVLPPDLAPTAPAGWDAALLPRETPDASAGSAPAPVHLTGDVPSYVNVAWANGGTGSADSATTEVLLDGVPVQSLGAGVLAAGATHTEVNVPQAVPGGRHTLEARVDAGNALTESDETDNTVASTWVFEPATLSEDVSVARTSPPDPAAGMGTPGAGPGQNQDGIRLSSAGSSHTVFAAALHASDPAENYDLAVYPASTGPTDGFLAGSETAVSARAAGLADIVLFPVRDLGAFTVDAGLLDTGGSATSDTRVDWRGGNTQSPGDVVALDLAEHQLVALGELAVGPAEAGSVVFELTSADSAAPLHLAVFPPGGGMATLDDAAWTAVTSDSLLGPASTLRTADLAPGYYPWIVYREPVEGTAPLQGSLRIRRTPADVAPATPAGGYSPLVPAATLSVEECIPWNEPVSLPSDAPTFFRYSWGNLGPGASLDQVTAVDLDGVAQSFTDPGQPALGEYCRIGSLGTVSGGRHTLALRVDVYDANAELFRDNDTYGEQWVWEPAALAVDVAVNAPMPPPPTAGWESTTVGPLSENVSGYRTPALGSPGPDGVLALVAAVPDAGADVDLRMYAPSAGPQDGFDAATQQGESAASGQDVDFLLVDTDPARGNASGAHDVGVRNSGGNTGYTTELTLSRALPPFLGTTTAVDSLPAGRVARVFETAMGAPSGPTTLRLRNLAGDADLGLAVLPLDGTAVQGRAAALVADANGAGGLEDLVFDLPAGSPYAVVVFKHGATELAKAAAFELYLGDSTATASPITAGPPAVTRLRGVAPNPFASTAVVAVELSRPGRAEVTLYDATGRVVRRLLDGDHASGRYDLPWDGRDAAGRRVGSGVYFVRFTAAGVDEVKKITRLH